MVTPSHQLKDEISTIVMSWIEQIDPIDFCPNHDFCIVSTYKDSSNNKINCYHSNNLHSCTKKLEIESNLAKIRLGYFLGQLSKSG